MLLHLILQKSWEDTIVLKTDSLADIMPISKNQLSFHLSKKGIINMNLLYRLHLKNLLRSMSMVSQQFTVCPESLTSFNLAHR